MTDIQYQLRKAMLAREAERRRELPQLSLGELIAALDAVEDHTAAVSYDFEYAFPTTLDSWRGIYAHLALGFGHVGYGFGDVNKHVNNQADSPTVDALLAELRGAIGKEYTGWKGGDYTMGAETPVWVANPGNAGNTAIVGVLEKGYCVILETKYCET